MSITVKRRTYSGVVCEQEIYSVPSGCNDIKKAEPRPRFKNDEEKAAHREKMSRRNHERRFNNTFTPQSLYSTLTFDDAHEVFTFSESKTIRDNYIRRLKYAYPDAVIAIYQGRGDSTARIHMHMVSSGIPEDYIKKQWMYGSVVRVERLREHCTYDGQDHGPDYTALANYLYNHWTPEQGGHRYKFTKNVKHPDKEDAVEVKRKYTLNRPPLPPKGYELVESYGTTYGYMYFKYVKIPTKQKRTNKNSGNNLP